MKSKRMAERTMRRIEKQLKELEGRLREDLQKNLGNVRNTSSSDPTELLDMVSEGEMDYMAAICAQSGSVTLEEVETALTKLREGTYGICDECGQKISKRRLQVRPFAVLCVHCKEQMERQGYVDPSISLTARHDPDVYVDLSDSDVDSVSDPAPEMLRDMEDIELSGMF